MSARHLPRRGGRFEPGEHLLQCLLVGSNKRVGVRCHSQHVQERRCLPDSRRQVGAEDDGRVHGPERLDGAEVLCRLGGVHPGAVDGGPEQLRGAELVSGDVGDVAGSGEVGVGRGAPKQSELKQVCDRSS